MRSRGKRLLLLSLALLLLASAAASGDTLGKIVSAEHDGQGFVFRCEQGQIRITVTSPGVVRVEAARAGDSFFTPGEFLPGDECRELQDAGDRYVIHCKTSRIEATKEPLALGFYSADQQMNLEMLPEAGIEWQGEHYSLRFRLSGDRIYGLGEPDQRDRRLQLNLHGRTYQVWNRHLPPSRLIIPFLISSRGYGLFFDNPWKAEIDVGESFSDMLEYRSWGGEIRFYVFIANDSMEILEKYTAVTGRSPMPPLWALGYIQSKWGYKNRAEVEALADTFRTKRIPCDGIIIDLYWFKKMGDLAFDTENWPDPEEMIANLNKKGFHITVIEEPYVTTASFNHEEGLREGVFATDASGQPYVFRMWRGRASLVDFSNPKARQWWIGKHEELIGYGIEGWWADLNEPETDFFDMRFAGGHVLAQHNIQSLLMQETIFTALRKYNPDLRPLILSRSAFAGSQRYGTSVWSGDVDADWEDLARQPVLGQNTSMAGLPLWNSDIGGFWGDPTPELYLRWLQFGLFTPVCRPHGAHSPREPWQYGWEVEELAKKAVETRYSLLPYIYSSLYRAHRSGEPLMRPLFTAFPDDPKVANLGDQFLFGPSLLVAPVLEEGASSRSVYLPEGLWYDFWSGEAVQGGREIIADAPLKQIPVFVRGGSVIPRIEPMQHTGEKPWDRLFIDIYAGADGSFDLYEDDGRSNGYLDGQFSITPITYVRGDTGLEITIAKDGDGYVSKPKKRHYLFRIFGAAKPINILYNGNAIPESSGLITKPGAGEGWYFDSKKQLLRISLPAVPGRVDVSIRQNVNK